MRGELCCKKLITCKNLSLGYDGNAVVRNLDFAVEHGDYLWIVGENGSGKTTLLKGLLRLLNPLNPVEGSIVFCDELRQGRIGYLPQQASLKKDFPAGVYEIVLSGNLGGIGLRPFYSVKEKALAAQAMEQLGIAHLKKRCFRELSGGQQRRVLLARALCAAETDPVSSGFEHKAVENSCRLLVLDEPAAGLDPLITAEVYELLKTLNSETGITIIMVSHDTRTAEQYATGILHLEEGRGFFGKTDEYLASDMGRKFFGRQKEENDDR